MAAPSKAQLLTEVHALLKKRYTLEPRTERMTVLEAVVYGLCHEGTTREQANQALSRFKDDFFDWNEVRVSSLAEIQGVLAGLPEPEARAHLLRRFLRLLFEKLYRFDLEGLTKKPLKEAIKTLQEYEAFQSDYLLATVIQQALGGHAIPVDAPTRRALERLGVADPSADVASLRATLERAIPKNRGSEFVDLMEELANDTCVEGTPDCPRCELRKICPTGQARMAAGKVTGKASAAIPEPKSSKSAKAKTADSESASRSNPAPDGTKPSRIEAKSPAKKSPPPK
jgi:endonuclease-3